MTGNIALDTLQKYVISKEGKYEGTALICRDIKISFEEFDMLSAHIAHFLTGKGIGPGSIVELSMSRSEKMILAMYGVFKAGACLLPLPSDLPKKKEEMIRGDINIALTIDDVLYEKAMETKVEDSVCYSYAEPSNDAIILYTSGSTGNPKGVRHSQSSKLFSCNQFPRHCQDSGIPISEINTVIAKTNEDFVSAYLFEILLAPLTGRSMVVLTKEEQNSSMAVGETIASYDNASIFMTPSQTMSFLGEKSFRTRFANLGNLILAGERLKPEARDVILKYAGNNTSIINIYGSSECHLMSAGDVRSDIYPGMIILPGVEALCQAEDGSICKKNERGEIVINSPCAFDGYTNTEKKTIEINGKTYIKTGDEGEMSEDGSLYIIGRIDRMIKLHGLRVELGDIENSICRYPGIDECAVVQNRTEAGNEVLCAYYVGSEEVSSSKIREFLGAYIRETLIPVGFIRLDEFPLNSHGKIDYPVLSSKIFLPECEEKGIHTDEIKTDKERIIIEILSGIWEGKEITPASNLFRLGLDSLAAFRLMGELRQKGYAITVPEIFGNPVLGDMAGLLRECAEDAQDEPQQDGDVYAATGTQIYWGTEISIEKKSRGMYVPATFICEKSYTKESFENRVDLMLRKHPAFGAVIVIDGQMPGQRIVEDPVVIKEFEDIREMKAQDTDPFEPSNDQWNIIRQAQGRIMGSIIQREETVAFYASCFRFSDKASLVIIVGNHISVDGSSMNILMQEFASETLDEGRDSYLEFLKYIHKETSLNEAIGFWHGYLQDAEFSGLPKTKEAQADEELPQDFRGITIPLSDEETKILEEKCLTMGVSVVGYIMYLYGRSLMKILEKDALIMQILTFGRGVPVSGLDSSVGCFIENIPIVIRKDDTPASFQKGYLQAEQNSFLLAPILWKTSLGLDEPPELAPFIISEIFPPVKTKGYFKEIAERDYAAMFMSNFIVMEEGHLCLYFHYDANKFVEEIYISVIDELKELLMKSCR